MGKRAYVKRMYNAAGEPSDLVIPSNDRIWKIGPYACYNSKTLRSVFIPRGVTEIGFKAFFKCTVLEHIELPPRLASIADCAFKNCESLESIVIPDGVTSIGYGAFMSSGLKHIVIPDSVTHIGKHAFLDCKLGEMDWENARYAIKNGMFIDKSDGSAYCADSSLENVIIPNGVKHLVSFKDEYRSTKLLLGAFHNSKVKSVYIPESVELTDTNTFNECKTLEKVEFKNPAINFGRQTFKACTSLTDVVLPAGLSWAKVKSKFSDSPYGYTTEENKNNDKSNKLSQLNEQILPQLFSDWDHIIDIRQDKSKSAVIVINFPNGNSLCDILSLKKPIDLNEYLSKCQEIANSSDGIKTFYFNKMPKGNPKLKTYSKIERVIIKDSIRTIKAHFFERWISLQSVILPKTVTLIGEYAFWGCSNLQHIELPDGLTSIEEGAFAGCSNLQHIELPDSLTSIGNWAFRDCSNLQHIELPNGVTSIEHSAFEGCSNLQHIKLPDSLTSIRADAFAGCSNLQHIELPEGVTSIEGGAFKDCSNLQHIKLPNGVTGIWNRTFAGCSNLQHIELPDGVTCIEFRAFAGCSNLQHIKLPKSVVRIEAYAFLDCKSLSNLIIGNPAIKIDNSAFVGCINLLYENDENELTVFENGCLYSKDRKTLLLGCAGNGKTVIKAGVVEIGDRAFSKIDLESIEIPETVTKLGVGVFDHCMSLKSVTIPNSLTEIPKYTFCCCSNLKNITISKTITKIGDSAFFCCNSLLHISLPSSVKEIGNNAFNSCKNLESITIPDSVIKIGEHAFSGCENLEKITIPDSVEEIGNEAFKQCSKLRDTTITIPKSVRTIDIRCLLYRDQTLKVLSLTPPEVNNDHNIDYNYCQKSSKILVPAESVELYKEAEGWSFYKDIIDAIKE